MPGVAAIAIVVHLSNLAGVPAHTLTDARAEVVRLFSEVGVSIEWAPAGSTDVASRPDAVRLHLIEQETGDLRKQPRPVLGAAVTTGHGTQVAWVFWRRVEAEAARSDVRVQVVLASAIAHEIGHLLLPGRDHAASGLMRASWSDRDFQRAALGSLRFSAEEGAQIRANLDHTSASR